MPKFSGASSAATGDITANTASVLAFANDKQFVIVSNRSGQICYCVINDDTETPTASSTVYDFVLDDKASFIVEEVPVENVTVYVNATSGVRVVGWD